MAKGRLILFGDEPDPTREVVCKSTSLREQRSVSVPQSLLRRPLRAIGRFTLVSVLFVLTFGCSVRAVAATSTTTTLAVTAGGSATTAVVSKTVVTLTATVKAGATAVTTGQVNFCDATAKYCTDIHLLGTEQLTSAGTAMLKFVPGIGSHSYKAIFVGTTSDASSSSSDSALKVTGTYPTATTIAQSGSAGNYTLTATVAGFGDAPGQASPTGMVSFLDTSNGNSVLGRAALQTVTPGLSWFNSQTPATGTFPSSIAVGDFNGDGHPDLAVVNYGARRVTQLLGNGDGTFNEADGGIPYIDINSAYPDFVAVGDFNGDGKADLVIASSNGNTLTVFLGNGDGTFKAAPGELPTTGNYPYSIVVGDFNRDGNADLAVANLLGNTVTVLLGNGDGTFTAAKVSPATGRGPNSIAVGDFNGDGIPDLAVTNSDDNTVTVLLGNGDGTFSAAKVSPATGINPSSIAVGDFNGDGKADLAVVNLGDRTVTVLLGNGDGTFTASRLSPSTGNSPNSVAVGDFNGDGVPDLAVTNYYDETVTILLGNGDGTFKAAASPMTGHEPRSLAVGDFNGDGIPDVAVVDYSDNTVTVLLGVTQSATATVSGIAPGGKGAQMVEASYPGDINHISSISGTTWLPTTLVSLSDTGLSFIGGEPVGYSSGLQAVFINNIGDAPLTIVHVALTGADATSFASSNTCGTNLAVGATCRIDVRFVPKITGALTATITLTYNATGSPQSITLSGTGITAPVASLSLSSTSLSFGSEPVGSSTAVRSVTLTNTSEVELYFSSITLTGADAMSFASSNTCGISLAAGVTCSIAARFAPTVTGALTATLALTDSATGSPQSIALSGTGLVPVVSLSSKFKPI